MKAHLVTTFIVLIFCNPGITSRRSVDEATAAMKAAAKRPAVIRLSRR